MSADCRPLAQDVATDAAIAAHFSTRAEIEAIVTFEAALAETQAALGMIPEAAGHAIAATARSFEPPLDLDTRRLRTGRGADPSSRARPSPRGRRAVRCRPP